MLIINADDWGMDSVTTDRILACFRAGKISSATAMMFMEDSKRSAELARSHNLPIGLHLNFTQPFSAHDVSSILKSYHATLVRYFIGKKFSRIVYNPLIKRQVEYCFKSQCDEFERLYGTFPTHIDGHHHIHLCANLMFSKIISSGIKIRRNVPFSKKEKNFFNYLWRSLIDVIIKKRFLTTERFFSLYSHNKEADLLVNFSLARDYNVEGMVHPGLLEEYTFIMSEKYAWFIREIPLVSYKTL